MTRNNAGCSVCISWGSEYNTCTELCKQLCNTWRKCGIHDLFALYTPSKHTCLDSLSLKPPAPLYPLQDFKALYKYSIIILLLLLLAEFLVAKLCRSWQSFSWHWLSVAWSLCVSRTSRQLLLVSRWYVTKLCCAAMVSLVQSYRELSYKRLNLFLSYLGEQM